jgi:hypothetical protein
VDQQPCGAAVPQERSPAHRARLPNALGQVGLSPRKDRYIDRPTDAREPDQQREAVHGQIPDNRSA